MTQLNVSETKTTVLLIIHFILLNNIFKQRIIDHNTEHHQRHSLAGYEVSEDTNIIDYGILLVLGLAPM